MRLGAHLSIAGGMHKALEAALALGCETMQVFVKNQRQWRAKPLAPADVERWHELLASSGVDPVVAHATYLINLASPDSALRARSQEAFAEELLRCDELGIQYMVVHPGAVKESSREEGVRRVARGLDSIFERYPDLSPMVLLETTAGQGTTLGRTFGELGAIIGEVSEPTRVGICVDTCHIFAAGYDIRTPSGYAKMLAEAQRDVGLERIRCWHLNDSRGALGSHLDRHAHIGHGELGRDAFRNVLTDKRFRGVPLLLETPKGVDERERDWDVVNLACLRGIEDSGLVGED